MWVLDFAEKALKKRQRVMVLAVNISKKLMVGLLKMGSNMDKRFLPRGGVMGHSKIIIKA